MRAKWQSGPQMDNQVTIICKHQVKFYVSECKCQIWPYITNALSFGGVESETKTIDLSKYLSYYTLCFIFDHNFASRCNWKAIQEILEHADQFGFNKEPLIFMYDKIKDMFHKCETQYTYDRQYRHPKLYIPTIRKFGHINDALSMKLLHNIDDALENIFKYTARLPSTFKFIVDNYPSVYTCMLKNTNETIYNYLARKKYVDSLKILLNGHITTPGIYDVVVRRVDEFGNNLLHTICANGLHDSVNDLLDWIRKYSGDDINVLANTLYELTTMRNNNGELPVHLAASSGKVSVLTRVISLTTSELLTKQEVLQLESTSGSKLIHYAARSQIGYDVIRHLQSEDDSLNLYCKDQNGMSIIEIAESVGNKHLITKFLDKLDGNDDDIMHDDDCDDDTMYDDDSDE